MLGATGSGVFGRGFSLLDAFAEYSDILLVPLEALTFRVSDVVRACERLVTVLTPIVGSVSYGVLLIRKYVLETALSQVRG